MTGRVCIVTGGGSGIGRAACVQLSRAGYQVAVCDNDGTAADGVAEYLTTEGSIASSYRVDVRDEAAVASMIDHVLATWGSLDALVTCAGIAGKVTPVSENERKDIEELLFTNLLGTIFAVKHSVRHMRAQGGGTIVCVASAAALVGSVGRSAYCASKAAVAAFAKCAAVECAPFGIRINVVSPGIIDTPMVARVQGQQPGAAHSTPPIDNLINRMGTPGEVAASIRFLVSDDAGFMYGTELVVDGGKVAR